MKKIIVLLLVLLTMTVVAGVTLAATCCIKVYVDGSQVVFPDQQPFVNADSRTLVPVRFVSEALGAVVEWDGSVNTVNITHKDKAICLVIGQKQAKVDLGLVSLDTAADLVNSRTMVPLRFVSECLGADVEWDGTARAVYITTFEKEVTDFVGKSLTKDILKFHTGEIIQEPTAQYMYVTDEQLPVKVGSMTIFCVTPREDYISVKQSTGTRDAAQMLIIQDGVVIGSRTDHVYPANPFIAQYDVRNIADEALGKPRVDINKVNAFAFKTRYGDLGDLFYVIVKNPQCRGDWSL